MAGIRLNEKMMYANVLSKMPATIRFSVNVGSI